VVDAKLSRVELKEFSDHVEAKLRCIARRLSHVDNTSDPAAGTRKALCLSCNSITRDQTNA